MILFLIFFISSRLLSISVLFTFFSSCSPMWVSWMPSSWSTIVCTGTAFASSYSICFFLSSSFLRRIRSLCSINRFFLSSWDSSSFCSTTSGFSSTTGTGTGFSSSFGGDSYCFLVWRRGGKGSSPCCCCWFLLRPLGMETTFSSAGRLISGFSVSAGIDTTGDGC